MSVVTRATAQAAAAVIATETTIGANTAARVGGLFVDLADSVPFGAAGDVSGPGAATSSNLPVFSGTTGKLLADSGQSPASILAAASSLIPSAGGAPVDVTKATASGGAASTWSRSDHKHDIGTAVPGSFSVAGVAASEGVSTSLARADHAHSLTGVLPPANGGVYRPSQGTNIPTGTTTISVSGGSQYQMVASTTSGNSTINLATTGSPREGDILSVAVYAQAHSVTFHNNGVLANDWTVVSAGQSGEYYWKWNTVDWMPAGLRRLA